MTDLPEHLKFWQEHYGEVPDFIHLYPFLYDNETSLFNIAGEQLSPEDFDPYTFHGLNYVEQSIRDVEQLAAQPVLIPALGELIVTPKMHEWTRDHRYELTEQAVPVMHAVYQRFYDEPIPLETGGGFMSFEAGIRSDGAIGLQVLGSCACFGPKYSGGMFDEGLEQDFAEYELHNADTQAQRAGLYAGMGHLAKLASEA